MAVMAVACARCGRKGIPRAPDGTGEACAHTREVRQGGDAPSEFRPCTNKPEYQGGDAAFELAAAYQRIEEAELDP